MSAVSPQIRDLARQLLALEAGQGRPSGGQTDEAVKVCEVLRVMICRLAGAAGFYSLFSRALTLARAEVPALAEVEVRPDGTLAGFDRVGRDHGAEAAGEGGLALVSQLLGLLVTFVGQGLTLGLLRDEWPGLPEGGAAPGSGGAL